MPRYHFNVHDGIDIIDRIGIELPGIIFARREAVRYAGTLLEQGAGKILPGADWRMEVMDHTGLLLFRLDFNVAASPAAESAMKSDTFSGTMADR